VFTGRHRSPTIRAAVPGLSDTMLAQRLRTLETTVFSNAGPAPPAPAAQIEYTSPARAGKLGPVLDAGDRMVPRWIPLPDDSPRP